MILSCACGDSWSGRLDKEDIKTVCNAVASWQMGNFDRLPNGQDCFITQNQVHWSSAVLYEGMYRWAEYDSNGEIFTFLNGIGEDNGWGLYSLRTPYHADDICVGQMYLEMYSRYGNPRMLEPTLERARMVASNPSSAPLSKKDTIGRYDRWSWCDALLWHLRSMPPWPELPEKRSFWIIWTRSSGNVPIPSSTGMSAFTTGIASEGKTESLMGKASSGRVGMPGCLQALP